MKLPFRKCTTKKYFVVSREEWQRTYSVEAENPDDALESVEYGLAVEVDNSLVYKERSNPKTWLVIDPDTGEVL